VSLELSGLVKSFRGPHGTQRAVDGVDLVIPRGEFVSMIGSSGCGKTTTLRLIAGLETPDSGSIVHEGREITHVPAARRGLRMMFQDYALFPHMTVGENVAFGLRVRAQRGRHSAAEIDRLVDEHLELVHLPGVRNRRPNELSGGQRQRVALARALVTRPDVLLFDEPLGALDAGLRRAMQFELKRLHAELGKTFIYVTHDQEEALAISDRIAVMHEGRVLQYAPPDEIYFQPTTRYVARFVGSTNLLDGELAGRDGALGAVRLRNGTVVRGLVATGLPDTKVSAMIRADRIDLVAEGPSAMLSGRVRERLFLGTHDEFQVDVDGLDVDLTVHMSRRRDASVAPGVGARVGLRWAEEDVRVLSD